MHNLVIDSKERIFLDGKKLDNVTEYQLKHPAGEPAELIVSLLVTVNQVDFELEK